VKKYNYINIILLISLFFSHNSFSQGIITGNVIDNETQETLIGASIIVIGENRGTSTDFNGNFTLEYNTLPINIECSYMGYSKFTLEVAENKTNLTIKLIPDKLILSQINVVDTRLTEKLKQSPVTIEAMDVTAIREAPSSTFYESIGNLKGVDLTSASLGFKIINTRGFNSTSPVRSLQIIDGVDNQSPGLNFSLGNFLGTTELDTKGVEIIVGANSALYGPNAFNGVISMSTKDPFMFPGTSYQFKMGEQLLREHCFRYASSRKLKNNTEIGFKINLQYMKANDWEANNFNPAYDTESSINNPGGYDAVNIYGDEYNRTFLFTSKPGMGTVHRNGYLDSELVDYNTENLKFNTAIHLRKHKNEFIYSFNYGNGTTIYQGDNRISLKNIQFFQNRIELKRNDDFFIRIYSTHEDAGDSYDAVATAVALLEKGTNNTDWYTQYGTFWNTDIIPLMEQDLINTDYIPLTEWDGNLVDWINQTQEILSMNPELLAQYHEIARENANNYVGNLGYAFIEPGTEEFNTLFNEITTQTRYDKYGNLIGGTQFYDKSSLYHIHGEKKIDTQYGLFTIGANARIYSPDSDGSIFNDGYDYIDVYELNESGDTVFTESITPAFDPISGAFLGYDTIMIPNIAYIDTVALSIKNYEYGIYLGYDHKLFSETLLVSATTRVDKNENFDYVFSPATSLVYKPNEKDIIRLSLSSAVRNPTLTDQYFDYNQGQATLLGNLNGFGFDQYFVSIDSLLSYLRGENELGTYNQNALKGSFIRVNPIQPEQVQTAEIGFRTTLFDKLYIDASYYYSIYKNFIGYQIGATYKSGALSEPQPATQEDVDEGWAEYVGQEIEDYLTVSIPSIQVYRVAANATGKVTAQGFSIGLNYYMNERTAINSNYSWNKLINEDSKDPIIPAYNTPEHKFNIGLSNKLLLNNNEYNISVNYKWQQEFVFEGSPQFTGQVPSYGLVDSQINRVFNIRGYNDRKNKLTAKIGASNLLNNQIYQAYGGPTIGRLLYISLTFDY